MTHEYGERSSARASSGRRSVVAEALMEKLEKLTIGRMTLAREHEQMLGAVQEIERRMSEIQAQELELKQVLERFPVDVQTVSEKNSFLRYRQTVNERNLIESRAKAQVITEGSRETGHLKAQIIATARAVLQTVEYMPVRDLYEMLKYHKVEVSSAQRLSQILSESSEFEADRSRGWSVKR